MGRSNGAGAWGARRCVLCPAVFLFLFAWPQAQCNGFYCAALLKLRADNGVVRYKPSSMASPKSTSPRLRPCCWRHGKGREAKVG